MEQHRPQHEAVGGTEERWLDVDTVVICDNKEPVCVWFRYLTKESEFQEVYLPFSSPDDAFGIYGGLMAWTGRYRGDKLIAVQYAGKWHDLPHPMPA